ncbi:transposase family protein [Dellaglioa sp. P0083]|uniref:transposase family protein n=1 Tax=Dellaglioa kimchii TaxID=3344667 RepID=UPI0038D4C5F4
MSLTCIVQDLLLNEEPNLEFPTNYYEESPKVIRIFAKLTYKLTVCHQCHHRSVIKYGFKTVHLRFTPINDKPTILYLRKQRFMCHHCNHTWLARTSLADFRCQISNRLKRSFINPLSTDRNLNEIA